MKKKISRGGLGLILAGMISLNSGCDEYANYSQTRINIEKTTPIIYLESDRLKFEMYDINEHFGPEFVKVIKVETIIPEILVFDTDKVILYNKDSLNQAEIDTISDMAKSYRIPKKEMSLKDKEKFNEIYSKNKK